MLFRCIYRKHLTIVISYNIELYAVRVYTYFIMFIKLEHKNLKQINETSM